MDLAYLNLQKKNTPGTSVSNYTSIMSRFTTKEEFAAICGSDLEHYGTVEGKYVYEIVPIVDFDAMIELAFGEKAYIEVVKIETLTNNKLSKEEITNIHDNIYLLFSKILHKTLKQFMISEVKIKSIEDMQNKFEQRVKDYEDFLKEINDNDDE